jgi:hypothetical protein
MEYERRVMNPDLYLKRITGVTFSTIRRETTPMKKTAKYRAFRIPDIHIPIAAFLCYVAVICPNQEGRFPR